MIVDGKTIAANIYRELAEELAGRSKRPRLLVVTAAPNLETQKYLDLKRKRALALSIEVAVQEFSKEATTEDIEDFLKGSFDAYEGIIIQLPLPEHIDTGYLISLLPPSLDTDVANYGGEVADTLPPVVGAISIIAKQYGIEFARKNVAVVGHGRLVGQPAALWAKALGAAVTVLDKDTDGSEEVLKNADIIISGAGVPGLITPDQIKDGVVIFDAGTSEDGGVLKGDVDSSCAQKASLFTPVPGGIGPVTLAVLLSNLVALSKNG